MNKPILAAGAGVAFGLFLGMLHFGNLYTPTVCIRELTTTVIVPSAAPPLPEPVSPCQEEPAAPQPLLELTPPDPLSAAQTAFVDGEYAEAIELARDSRTAEPTRAWRITGAAACRLHDPKLADEAFRRVRDPASRQYLIYACQRSGMSRLGRHFHIDDQE